MATWQYEFSLVPTDATRSRDVKSELSSLLPKTDSWSESILIWGNIDGNRVQLFDDGTPPELLVRVDLRNDSRQFVRDLVSFATRMGYLMTNSDGKEVPPTTKSVAGDIAKSDAFRFVTAPEQFLESLEK